MESKPIVTYEYAHAVRVKYEELGLFDKPYVVGWGDGTLEDEDGEDYGIGIVVYFREGFDMGSVPEGERIPTCLDGVPVSIKPRGRIWFGDTEEE